MRFFRHCYYVSGVGGGVGGGGVSRWGEYGQVKREATQKRANAAKIQERRGVRSNVLSSRL